MTLDYDVVIVGGSLAGRYAALLATQFKAKVALVESQVDYELIYRQAMGQIAHFAQSGDDLANFSLSSIHIDKTAKLPSAINWEEAMLYSQGVVANIQAQTSPGVLAAQGVDVIFGSGQFSNTPDLAFAINQRRLRGRTYLLANGSRPAIPEIEGLKATGYLTLANIWQAFKAAKPPQDWVIIGGVPQSIEIAQTLAKLGCRVILIINHPYLIPHIDPEISQLLLAQLEADGVRVLTEAIVSQVRKIDDKKWLQVGDKAIEVDEIVVATAQQPNIESLNLSAANVKVSQQRLLINQKLQTTNRRIYACGDVIGGYDFANIAQYEARIAINNALFLPRFKVNYSHIPWAIVSEPMLTRVGLTPKQAQRRFGNKEIIVLRQYYKSIAVAQLENQMTGVCQLIVSRKGEILGATIFAKDARELIHLIALAMSQKIPVQQLANFSPIYPSFSEILEQIAREWNYQQLHHDLARQEWLESFFYFRRNWNL
ncbi:dihydrolipoyl dehydrogenase family protein [Aliinostoc sp. HNIBRCY26]|uniref:dihydrolipoyl dehydrogenase family protein n=1 Tax=Aliinostoc sp. HNIBRCY26 TaxID=3418997 RepID=UPI003D05F3DD